MLTDAGIEAAAPAAPPMVAMIDPTDPTQVGRALLDAAQTKNYSLLLSLSLVIAVWSLRRFGPDRLSRFPKAAAFIGSSRGGALLTFIGAFFAALASTEMAGKPFTQATVWAAISTAFAASGMWSMAKSMLAAPAKPTVFAEKTSAVTKPITIEVRHVPGDEQEAGRRVEDALRAHMGKPPAP